MAERVPLELAVTSDLVRRDFATYRKGDRLEFFRSRSEPDAAPTLLGVGIGAYLVNHHDDVAHLLQTGAHGYEKTRRLTNRRGRRLSGYGILTSTGDAHRERRELLGPSFRARAAVRDAETTARRASEWAASVAPGEQIDLRSVAFQIAERAIFQSTISTLDDDDLQEMTMAVRSRRRFLEYVYTSPIPYKEHTRSPIVTDHRTRIMRFEQIVRSEMQRRRTEVAEHDDLLGDLLALADGDAPFGDDDVIDEIRMVTLTGHETVADALVWTLKLLAEHPEAQRRVAEESRGLGGDLRVEDLEAMQLASAAASESLRLFPPTWLYVRRATQQDTLPSGLSVKRGAKFYICPYLLHRNPRLFPEPEAFDLDRFIENPRPPRGAYVPFGLGRHACLGEPYAKLTTHLVVGSILRHLTLVPAGVGGTTTHAGITLTSEPPPVVTVSGREGMGS